jgi:radical SAM protein with 4Fe4S-binding SPASM domain
MMSRVRETKAVIRATLADKGVSSSRLPEIGLKPESSVEWQETPARKPCAGLWNTPMVHINGDLTTCCLDTALENRLGNLAEQTLDELWNGSLIHSWRLAQIQGRFEESGPACTKCNYLSAGSYPDHRIQAYLEKTGEAAILDEFRRRKKGTDERKGERKA